jgi:hypothetical protein
MLWIAIRCNDPPAGKVDPKTPFKQCNVKARQNSRSGDGVVCCPNAEKCKVSAQFVDMSVVLCGVDELVVMGKTPQGYIGVVQRRLMTPVTARIIAASKTEGPSLILTFRARMVLERRDAAFTRLSVHISSPLPKYVLHGDVRWPAPTLFSVQSSGID